MMIKIIEIKRLLKVHNGKLGGGGMPSDPPRKEGLTALQEIQPPTFSAQLLTENLIENTVYTYF